MTDISMPEIGTIHRAELHWAYADGTHRQEHREIIVLDVQHLDVLPSLDPQHLKGDRLDGSGVRVTWQLMSDWGQGSNPAVESPRVADFPGHVWPAGAIRWDRSVPPVGPAALVRVSLGVAIGAYRPANSALTAEVMRDLAREEVADSARWELDRSWLLDRIKSHARLLDAIPAERDRLIRAALAAGVQASRVAEMAGMTPGRIYQIRDGRR